MKKPTDGPTERGESGAHQREQRRAWLALTHAERLAWLEQAKRFTTRHCGAAARRDEGRTSESDEA